VTPQTCAVCGAELASSAIRVRYEDRVYSFESERCKRIFQENPDRFLDAGGQVLPLAP
jgi:YHS domain-containing protein